MTKQGKTETNERADSARFSENGSVWLQENAMVG